MEPVATLSVVLPLVKTGIEQAWKWRSAKRATEAAQAEDIAQAYEYATRIAGAVLFELRANIERVRLIVEQANRKGDRPAAPFDLSVSDALMPRLCEVMPTPQLLGEFHLALAAIRRVDFYQRIAAQPRPPVNRDYPFWYDEGSHLAIGLARDAIQKGIVARFNELLNVVGGVGEAALGDAWEAQAGHFLPPPIDENASVNHSLL